MASTSTNKQPLLIDRPLHIIKDLTTRFVDVDVSIDPGAGNRGLLMLDCTQNDGAVIESVIPTQESLRPRQHLAMLSTYTCLLTTQLWTLPMRF